MEKKAQRNIRHRGTVDIKERKAQRKRRNKLGTVDIEEEKAQRNRRQRHTVETEKQREQWTHTGTVEREEKEVDSQEQRIEEVLNFIKLLYLDCQLI